MVCIDSGRTKCLMLDDIFETRNSQHAALYSFCPMLTAPVLRLFDGSFSSFSDVEF